MSSVILSEKGKNLLLVDGFKFSFQKMLAGNIKRWSCVSRKTACKAYVKTEGDDNIITDSMLQHNHEKVPENLLNRQILSNSVKRAAIDDICERPLKLIREQLKISDTITTKDIVRVRKNVYHARSSHLPRLPKNRDELHGLLAHQQIKPNEEFLVHPMSSTYTGIKCPKRHCTWTGPEQMLSVHFQQFHTPMVVGNTTTFPATVSEARELCFIFNERNFVIHKNIFSSLEVEDELEVSFAVQVIGNAEVASKYVFEVELLGSEEKCVKGFPLQRVTSYGGCAISFVRFLCVCKGSRVFFEGVQILLYKITLKAVL